MALMLSSRLLLQIRQWFLERTFFRVRRAFRIGGQGPRIRWGKNPGGLKRTIEEAVAIASRHRVNVPVDVAFFEAEPGDLKGSLREYLAGQRFETARGPDLEPRSNGRIYLEDHYNKDGRIPFRIHPDVLTSDEAIVAVFQHDMYELALMREVFSHSRDGSMYGPDYGIQASVGRPGSFHDRSWDEADKIVLRMRRRVT